MENIHPIFVHFPVAITFIALFFTLVAIIFPHKRELFKEMLMWSLLLGALAALTTAITGFYASREIPHNEAIHKIMEVHETYGIIIGASFLVLSLWMIIRRIKMQVGELVFLTIFLAALTGLVGYSASLGGKMVYEHGAGVGPVMEMMRDQESHHAPGQDHSHMIDQDQMQAMGQEQMQDSMQAHRDMMTDSTMQMPAGHDHSQHEH